MKEMILKLLASAQEPLSGRDIAAAIKMEAKDVMAELSSMTKDALLERERKANVFYYWLAVPVSAVVETQPVVTISDVRQEEAQLSAEEVSSLTDGIKVKEAILESTKSALNVCFMILEKIGLKLNEAGYECNFLTDSVVVAVESVLKNLDAMEKDFEKLVETANIIEDERNGLNDALASANSQILKLRHEIGNYKFAENISKVADKPVRQSMPKKATGIDGFVRRDGRITLFIDRRINARSISFDETKIDSIKKIMEAI